MESPAPRRLSLIASFTSLLFFSLFPGNPVWPPAVAAATPVHVGVVLDLGSPLGKKGWTSVSMAINEFYESHTNFSTRVVLHRRDSESDVVGAASAALDLLKNVQVQAIIGPITSNEAEFVADLGNKAQVPIVSYSASSPSLSSARTPYFVRAALNDSSQAPAIADLVRSFGWREVVPVYEDSDYGAGILPCLTDALQSSTATPARVPYRCVLPPNASDARISAELYRLATLPARVFVVHSMPALATRLFALARDAGLMAPGYTWIVTDGFANSLSHLDADAADSMQGLLGIRPHVPRSPALDGFKARWRRQFRQLYPLEAEAAEPNVFQLWAYDAAWALALAVESAGVLPSTTAATGPAQPSNASDNSSDLSSLGVSRSGPALLQAILRTRFAGVSGEFRLVDGQLQSSAFEIVNVVGNGARVVGFWAPGAGITRELGSRPSNSSAPDLKGVIWPGESTEVPKGWEFPTGGRRLRVGVPVKNGFSQFVNVVKDEATGRVSVTGYCIDVFDAVMSRLGYAVPYDYYPYKDSSESYDDLVYQVYLQRFDAVVGDITIIADRSLYVDFTLPYTESGVSMVVPVKVDKSKNAWIFLKPLTTDLWLGSLAFFFFTGFVVWVIEHRINNEFRGSPSQQFGTIFYFAFSTLVFAHKERLESNLSRFAVIIWVFVVLILTSSYTASLTSLLTVQQLQPSVTDLNELLRNGDYVGYQDGSFVGGLLKRLKFDTAKLKNYSTPEQYAEALTNGSRNGGVAAIFDEIPYLKLFLSNRCNDFAMVGRTYKTDGFGFVFPRGSPLVPDVSRAILNVTEGDEMSGIERKWFGETSCPSDSSDFSSTSLHFRSFSGLFLITGVVSMLALLFFLATFLYKEWDELKAAASETSVWKRVVSLARFYDQKDPTCPTFKEERPVADRTDEESNLTAPTTATVTPHGAGSQSPFSVVSNLSDINFGAPEEGTLSLGDDDLVVLARPVVERAIEMTGGEAEG